MLAFTELTRHQQRITRKVVATKHNLNTGTSQPAVFFISSPISPKI